MSHYTKAADMVMLVPSPRAGGTQTVPSTSSPSSLLNAMASASTPASASNNGTNSTQGSAPTVQPGQALSAMAPAPTSNIRIRSYPAAQVLRKLA
ncbi:hypothetical protein FRB90_010524 [Tulasnella sp. 427]|nr:hypothetical protein FRB90_010524 [Tulasnella sp. 427]